MGLGAQEYVRQVLLEKIIGESEQAAAALAAPGGLGMRAGAGLQPPNAQQAHQVRSARDCLPVAGVFWLKSLDTARPEHIVLRLGHGLRPDRPDRKCLELHSALPWLGAQPALLKPACTRPLGWAVPPGSPQLTRARPGVAV